MKVFAKFDEIQSMTLQDIKETKHYGHTFVRSFVRSDGQRENSIPSHKHSLGGYKNYFFFGFIFRSFFHDQPFLYFLSKRSSIRLFTALGVLIQKD